MEKLRVETLVLGIVPTNCYLAVNRETGALVVIDPADEAERIAQRIAGIEGKPEAILLTHGHFDHMEAAGPLKERYGIPVYAMEEELPVLQDPEKNLTQAYGRPLALTPDRLLQDGDTLSLAGFSVQVIFTPGHTAGSCCYYLPEEGALFAGDTLFRGSVGRTDLPTGSMARLRASVHQKLFVLPEGTAVYAGHGEETDIGFEKRYNPY